MVKIYLMVLVLGVVASVGYGAVWYYNDTQQRIATLRENNAKLEVAIETSEASIELLQNDIIKFQELNTQLQANLQQAEAYGDELRTKLREHNLTALAIRKPKLLEGKMNGATANLWRDITEDTGGSGDTSQPDWLQPREQTGTGSEGGNQDREDNSTTGPETEASPAS